VAQVIIRRDDGTEEVIREVDNNFDPEYELLFREGYHKPTKIDYAEVDIDTALEEGGFEITESNRKAVMDLLDLSGPEDEPLEYKVVEQAADKANSDGKLTKAKPKKPYYTVGDKEKGSFSIDIPLEFWEEFVRALRALSEKKKVQIS
jgi:hypothetical protein